MNGKISIFGGASDNQMANDEGLALYEHAEADCRPDLFIPRSADSLEGVCKRLKPNALYFACRFPVVDGETRVALQNSTWIFKNPKNGLKAALSLVDWGPNIKTLRSFDISPYAADLLKVKTDEELEAIAT